MRVYMLKREQHLNISLDHAWAFFLALKISKLLHPAI